MPDSIDNERIPDTVVEQPCEEDLDERAKASPSSKDKKMNDVDVGKDGVIQATVESWIEPTQIVQQTISVEKMGIQSLGSDKCSESNMVVHKRTEHSILTSADYTQAVNALDKTLDHHINLTQPNAVTKSKVETYMNMPNGETIRMPSNDEYKVCANGPCTKKSNYELTHVNGDASPASIRNHTVKQHDEQSSSVKRYIIALTAAAFCCFGRNNCHAGNDTS
uniref:SJCHGC06813 protein n=1 Tax=Schistosoma japonicum TaxID=6182 RepID=Q5DCL0_SCHJA|nr:SJCHGC06813 protein [Schistosoma japonicum]